MDKHSDRLESWLGQSGIEFEFLRFATSVHTVEEAISASGIPIEHFTKSIAMITADGAAVIAVVPGECRASTERARKALHLDERPEIMSAEQSELKLRQQLGGNSPLDAQDAIILVDPRVAEKDWIVVGGGDDRTLVKLPVSELKRAVDFTEVRVRK